MATKRITKLHDLAADEASERQDRAEAQRRGAERDKYFRPYDAVWSDLLHSPCNPVAGKPLDPDWLLERLTTLAGRARLLDEFDGGTAYVDRLRWLPLSGAANKSRIGKALAIAIAAAVDGDLSHGDTAAFCNMLAAHPGNEVVALYRAKQADERPVRATLPPGQPDSKPDNEGKNEFILPENDHVTKLAKAMANCDDPKATKASIAREYVDGTGENAESLLRQLNRYPHLLNGTRFEKE